TQYWQPMHLLRSMTIVQRCLFVVSPCCAFARCPLNGEARAAATVVVTPATPSTPRNFRRLIDVFLSLASLDIVPLTRLYPSLPLSLSLLLLTLSLLTPSSLALALRRRKIRKTTSPPTSSPPAAPCTIFIAVRLRCWRRSVSTAASSWRARSCARCPSSWAT